MELRKYDYRFDLIRAVAILMVIAIHSSELCCQAAINEAGFGINKIMYGILQIIFIAVPVFVMLSGTLLLGKDEPLGIFFKKRLARVMIPWLVWSVIVYALTYVQNGGRSLAGFIEELTEKTLFGQGAHSIYWYIYVILGLYLVTPVLRKLLSHSDKKSVYYLFLLLLILFVLTKLCPTFTLTQRFACDNLEYLMYFVGGYAIYKYACKEKWFPILTWIFFAVGWMVMATRFAVTNSFADYLGITRPVACLGFFSLFFLRDKYVMDLSTCGKWSKIKWQAVKYLSMVSYGVYLSHFLFISLFLRIPLLHEIPAFVEIVIMVFGVTVTNVLMLSILRKTQICKYFM